MACTNPWPSPRAAARNRTGMRSGRRVPRPRRPSRPFQYGVVAHGELIWQSRPSRLNSAWFPSSAPARCFSRTTWFTSCGVAHTSGIAALVDGRRSDDEIVAAAIERGVDAATAWHALFKLESNGHLTRSRPALDQDACAFWTGLGVDPAEALAALGSARVRVFSIGTVDTGHFSTALRRCGIAAVAPPLDEVAAGSDGDFDVVLADDYLADALLALDEAARSAGRRWMLVRPAGFQIWIGPLLEPGTTGCLHCLRQRHGRYRSVDSLRGPPRTGTRDGEAASGDDGHEGRSVPTRGGGSGQSIGGCGR